jgi:hypothetical protein
MPAIEHLRSAPASTFRRDPVLPSGNSFLRLLTAQVLAQVQRIAVADIAIRMWPRDRLLEELLTRAATAPAMTTTTGWAAELAHRVVADGIEALGPASAGAQVLQRALVLAFDGAGSISAPGLVAEFGNAGWVAEGDPIPVRQLSTTAAILSPHKLGAIAVLTRQMIQSSNAEQLIGDALMRAAGRMLDEVLFDANPADAARPAGLRNGVSTLTASANADPFAAFLEDLAALINAVAPVGGNGPYIIAASPGRAALMAARAPGRESNVVFVGSSAIVNDVLAIAPAALVAALSPAPEIEVRNAATLHMDTAPTAVGSASPRRSLFQTDSIGLKMRWPVTWALRDARGFAWTTPTWK